MGPRPGPATCLPSPSPSLSCSPEDAITDQQEAAVCLFAAAPSGCRAGGARGWVREGGVVLWHPQTLGCCLQRCLPTWAHAEGSGELAQGPVWPEGSR